MGRNRSVSATTWRGWHGAWPRSPACVIQACRRTGGLHVPETPSNATGNTSQCFTVFKATSSGFNVDAQVAQPNTQGIYNCSPANVIKLPGFPQAQ